VNGSAVNAAKRTAISIPRVTGATKGKGLSWTHNRPSLTKVVTNEPSRESVHRLEERSSEQASFHLDAKEEIKCLTSNP